MQARQRFGVWLVGLFVGVAACGSFSVVDPESSSTADGGSPASRDKRADGATDDGQAPLLTPVVPASGSACEAQGVGKLPGVKLTIRSSKCTYRVLERATFQVTMIVDGAVPTIDVPLSKPCGVCFQHTSSPDSFFSWYVAGKSNSGVQQQYCDCDNGCCAGESAKAIKPDAIEKTIELSWSGRNWGGASDTGNPEGDAFPPGHYHVYATFNGFDQGQIVADLPIEVVP